jgi:uncharacterized phage protein (TIGR02220 family)
MNTNPQNLEVIKMAQEKREFKGIWIPKEIWLDMGLSAIEKIIFAEINSLDGEDGCYASNAYLAKFCQCSESYVTKAISKLQKLNYIKITSFDGRQRKMSSSIVKFTSQSSKDSDADSEKQQEHNNNSNNNKYNNKNNNKNNNSSCASDERTPNNSEAADSKFPNIYKDVIDYLNKKSGSRYKYNTQTIQTFIRARQKEGFTLQDFCDVIDFKCSKWLNDAKMSEFLRPSTLFCATHFQEYLNEAHKNSFTSNAETPTPNKPPEYDSNGVRQVSF